MSFMRNDKIAILGSTGFLGSRIKKYFESKYCNVICIDRPWVNFESWPSVQGFIYNQTKEARSTQKLDLVNIDTVFNCLGYNGGIEFQNQPDIFAKNTLMNLNALKLCKDFVKPIDVVSFVASCAYPANGSPYLPKDFMNGEPHSSVAQHGYAKRNLYLTSKFLNESDGIDNLIHPRFCCVCPPTLFGPGDRFDKNSKVIGAIIGKMLDAKKSGEPVELLGSGFEKRQFLYVDDFVKRLFERSYQPDKVWDNYPFNGKSDWKMLTNAPSSIYITIRDLARNIAHIIGLPANKYYFQSNRPLGATEKYIDTDWGVYDWSITPLYPALEETIKYAKENRNNS